MTGILLAIGRSTSAPAAGGSAATSMGTSSSSLLFDAILRVRGTWYRNQGEVWLQEESQTQ